jgi:hypothetical protein
MDFDRGSWYTLGVGGLERTSVMITIVNRIRFWVSLAMVPVDLFLAVSFPPAAALFLMGAVGFAVTALVTHYTNLPEKKS